MPLPSLLTVEVSDTEEKTLNLTWQDNSSNEEGFKIIEGEMTAHGLTPMTRRPPPYIVTIDVDSVTNYSDGNLAYYMDYFYRDLFV